MPVNSDSTSFVHLKVHSEFSLIDGLVRIGDLVATTQEQQLPAIALTDHCNLFGLVKMFKKSTAAQIKPIVGADLVLRDEQDELTTFTALCMNDRGYRNLTELISQAYLEGQFKDQPTVCWDWVVAKNEGLIILSGAKAGDIGQLLLHKKALEAKQRAERWSTIFPDRFYVELTRTSRENEENYLHQAVALALELELPVVATNDVRFINSDDFRAHEARVCIHDGYTLEDPKRPRNYSAEQYLKTPEQMAVLFEDIPEALQNTVEIAKRCNVKLHLGDNFLPNYPIPEGFTIDTFLRAESEKGLKEALAIYKSPNFSVEEYQERLDLELKVICDMGFPGYFLIVADFIQWAKNQGIPVGPGRGSGAGSLVAYVLKITELDPLEHELLFERFLNPERVSMPDFDIDFCMERRDEVIAYVADKYGRDAVSQIITYGTMAAKAVVRDVGRVLGLPYGFVDKIAKLIPFELGMTLEKALKQEEQLSTRYNEEEEVRNLINLAMRLEGVSRNAGKHAGGVLIAPSKLTDFTPIYCEPGGKSLVSQFDKDDVEAIGLVKFDFLGLRTLTIIDWAVQAINERLQKSGEPLVDITQIPLDDAKTFKLLKANATSAVFQLESRGMKDLIKRLQPDSFDDITALVALFRPGPLQSGMVDDFIDRKHGRQKVVYDHPDIALILKPTYGVILYQEQVMQIAQVLANYTLGGADILRRAMGKKKPEEMAKQRAIFLSGASDRGIDKHLANGIFDLMEKFAGYGFNKSHSAAYALIAYRTAWLKAHYPAEFMAAVLSSDMDNTDKVVGFLDECQRMNLVVNNPNINVGNFKFTVNEAGEIEYGLGAIKGAGEAALSLLFEDRSENGAYEDLFDLCKRLDTRKLNKRVLEALIKSGSLDSLEENRGALLASITKALKAAEQHARDIEQGQNDLFGGGDVGVTEKIDLVDVPRLLDSERLAYEKESLGHYISGHPLELAQQETQHFTTCKLNDLGHHVDKTVTVAGQIQALRILFTKSGRKMAALTLEDTTGRVECMVFAKVFEDVRERLVKDLVVVLKGEVGRDDFTGGYKIQVDALTDINSMRARLAKKLMIHVHGKEDVGQLLPQLSETLQNYRGGSTPVVISYQKESMQTELQLGEDWEVKLDDELIEVLNKLCGKGKAQVVY